MIKNVKRKKRTLNDDIQLLEYLMHHQVKEAAVQFGTSEPAIRAWLNRLRKRIVKLQNFITRVRTLQRTSPRIRKLTAIGGVPEPTEEEKF